MASVTMHRMDTPDLLDLQQQAARAAGLSVSFRDRSRDDVPVPELLVIPAGEFEMGSDASEFGHQKTESPRRFVSIERPFALGRHPVTKAEFAAFQAATGWKPRPEVLWPAGDRQPVFNVRMRDAEAYLAWLREQTGQRYRLPTEAEWEFAARAGTRTAFAFGDSVGCRDVHFNSLFPYEERRERRGGTCRCASRRPGRWMSAAFRRTSGACTTCTATCRSSPPPPGATATSTCRATASTGAPGTRNGWW
jgi:formylglycine-generating enzyme required for sulfatase activity